MTSSELPDGRVTNGSPNAVLGVVLISYLMIVLDISIVVTGLPEIRADLGFTSVGLSWVQNIYTLFFGGFLLLAARAGDLVGRKRMLLVGLWLFTASSLAIGLALTPAWLVIARAVQGVGAAILAPSVLALISTTFPEGPERTRALAYYSMVAGSGASLGLVLGGVFADQLSWRVGFFMNVPIGLALITMAMRVLNETPRQKGSFDVIGAVSSTLGMGALVYAIVHSTEVGWMATSTLGVLVIAIGLLVFFIVTERRVAQPVLPLRLFASRERVGAYLGRLLFLGAMVSFFFFSTQFMQLVLGFSPLQAGIGFLPMTLPTFVAALSVPMFTRYLGNGGLLCVSLVLLAVGMFWLSLANADASYWFDIALPMLLIGLGNGAALGPLTVAGVNRVHPDDQGAASGMVNVAHQMGGTLGLGILVAVFAHAGSASLSGTALLSHQISTAVMGSSIMSCLALVTVLLLIVPASKPKAVALT